MFCLIVPTMLLCFFLLFSFFFFFNDTATTEIYTLPLHDALPIYQDVKRFLTSLNLPYTHFDDPQKMVERSEEHTSELQSHSDLVCRLLLEKKKKNHKTRFNKI